MQVNDLISGASEISGDESAVGSGTCGLPRDSQPRPPRKMPDLYRMALYWSEWPEFFEVDLDAPHCFRCDVVVVLDETKTRKELWREASRYLHRAHLADRYLGGLDGPQNLVPLCGRCHRSMPSFDDGDSAIRWCWAQWRYSDYETRPISPRILPDPEPDDEQAPPAPVGQGALF